MIYRGDYTRNSNGYEDFFCDSHKYDYILEDVKEHLKSKDIIYSYLNISDLNCELLNNFNRYQNVTYVVRNMEGIKQIVLNPYVDDWDYTIKNEIIFRNFKECLLDGGVVIIATYNNYVIGFASLFGKPIGSKKEYYELAQLHVSYEFRRFNIGSNLFNMCVSQVKEWGGRRLYIQAHQAYETQEFYKAMGCVNAKENILHHVIFEPYDCQLEFNIEHPVI